ncbi:MAG: ABC transporter permease [Defluviitaleaceae bacterium]|nr:ABC transporter permease [Defluviitaleaceae bacterium]
MKPYISLFRVRLLNGLQYRAAAFGGLATQFFWGLMLVFIFAAFYGEDGYSNGFSFSDLVTYIWLQQAFLAFIFLYDWDNELLEMITTGGISYELCRPVNLYQVWYVKLFSKRLASGLLRFSPTVLIGLLLPYPYNLSLPHSPLAFLLFIVTLFLALTLLVAIAMLIYISIFKTMHPGGSIMIFGVIGEFFSGLTIPIPLMPLWLQNVTLYLPFRYTADLPLRVYSGHIGTQEALMGIAMQIFWITILVTVGALIMKRITRLSVVQGG